MKIALVKRRYSLKHGGSERYCVTLARQLQRAGHSVSVIGERIDDELASEVEFIRVPVNRATSWTRNRSFAENCGREAKRHRFDIVYGLGRSHGLDAVRVTERLQSHWVNVNYRNRVSRFLQTLNPRHRMLIDLERRIYRSGDVRRVITQSTLDRRLVVEYYGIPEDKIRTIHNGVDTDLFHPQLREQAEAVRSELGLAQGEPLLLFASMDFEGKGLRYVLQSLRAIKDRDARLVVLGTGPQRRFKRIARFLDLGKRVVFAGRRSDIQRYYAAADLFILPTAYEPFPNVNLEAMACGTPVLTTATAGGADVVRHAENGYVVARMEAVGEMIACLDRHLSLPASEREGMSRLCRETAEAMTVERNARETLEMFEEVLREKFRV